MFWRLLEKVGIHGHHQNLDKRPGDRFQATGHLWKHGRAWAQIGEDYGKGKQPWLKLYGSWNLWSNFCGLEVSCNDEDGLVFHVALPPVSFWLGIHLKWLRDWYFKHHAHTAGFRIFAWTIWLDLWSNEHEWRGDVPWWSEYRRRWNWAPFDTLLGKWVLDERQLRTEKIVVPMPEANYEGTAVLKVRTRKRQRWPWWPATQQWTAVDIDMTDPVPIPGKGTASYNCGEDATYGVSGPSESIDAAVGDLVKRTLERRRQYGGKDWKPEAHRVAG